ncbi:MAG: non-heme iron oxygenase ferredoxin subunit [Elusimicrobiota bacterium]
MSEFIKVGVKKDFPEGRATGIKVGDRYICVAHAVGAFYSFDDRCTHAESLISGGDIEEGDEVSCPLHGARFSIKTGKALTPPAVRSVKTHEVKVEGENIFIKLSHDI